MTPHDDWRLRAVTVDDVDGIHALAGKPDVYRYLFDGIALERQAIVDLIAQCVADAAETGLGFWVLEGPSAPHAGGVRLQPDLAARSAEITYLLDPAHWGQGLATRIAWTAISLAFRTDRIDRVIAGADAPNAASQAVMTRLGMRFHGHVQYPLGAGVEYVLHRDAPGPTPRPILLPVA